MSVTFLTNEDKALIDKDIATLSEEIEELKESGTGGNWGEDNAGKLLYIDADGNTSPLIIEDGLEVYHAIGKNIVKEEWENAKYNTDGSYAPQTSGKYNAAVKGTIAVTPGETYTMSYSSLNGATWASTYIAQYTSAGQFIGEIKPGSVKKATFTVAENADHLRLYLYSEPAEWETVIPNNFMIEAGSEATAYEPYQEAAARIRVSKGIHAASADTAESISNSAYAEHAPSLSVKSIAHRGAPGNAPECTAPAYILAKKLGFPVAENDVALTADGKYVMWHDTSLAKCGARVYDLGGRVMYTDESNAIYWVFNSFVYTYNTETGEYEQTSLTADALTPVNGSTLVISEQPYWLLRLVDVGKWKDNLKFTGTQMLSFEEWIDLCKALGMECYIDQKFSFTEEQAAELVSIVRRKGMLRKCSWLGSLENVRKADPKARCGVLYAPTESSLVENGLYDKALKEGGEGSVFWNPAAADVIAENASMALDKGYGYECWYVDVPSTVTDEQYYAEVERLLNCGCQNLTLDNHTVNNYMMHKYGKQIRKA